MRVRPSQELVDIIASLSPQEINKLKVEAGVALQGKLLEDRIKARSRIADILRDFINKAVLIDPSQILEIIEGRSSNEDKTTRHLGGITIISDSTTTVNQVIELDKIEGVVHVTSPFGNFAATLSTSNAPKRDQRGIVVDNGSAKIGRQISVSGKVNFGSMSIKPSRGKK